MVQQSQKQTSKQKLTTPSMSGQSYNTKLIATVSAIDSTASDVLEVEIVS